MLPDGLRERGAEVDVVALYETVAEPLDEAQRRRSARRRLRDLHLVLDRPLLPVGRPATCPTARASSRSARSTSATAREHGLEVHVEAERARRRRPGRGACRGRRGTRVARRDRHAADRLRPRRRVRRRLPRGHPRHRPRRADRGHHPRRSRATACARARSCCATRCPYMPVGRARGGRRSAGRAPSGARSRCERATGACSSDPTTGCSASPGSAAAGSIEAVDMSRSPHRLEPVSATFHGRDIFAPVAAHLARWRRAGGRGRARRPGRAQMLELPQPRVRGRRGRRARAGRRPVRQRVARRRARRHGGHRPHARQRRSRSRRAASGSWRRSSRRSPTCARAS